MPRITDERREARREQILRAAQACVQEHGLEAVSMEMIIARSGLSTGAVYRYFRGKDQIISAAVAGGTAGLARALAPVFANPDPPPPPEFIGQVLSAGVAYALRDPETDLLQAAIHGWSYIQTVPELKAASMAGFAAIRDQFAETVQKWQAAGTVDPAADPHAIAQLLMSILMGFVAQHVLVGGADDVTAYVAALTALTSPSQPLITRTSK